MCCTALVPLFPLRLHISLNGRRTQTGLSWLTDSLSSHQQWLAVGDRAASMNIAPHKLESFLSFSLSRSLYVSSFFSLSERVLPLSESEWCKGKLALTSVLVIRMEWQSLHHDTSPGVREREIDCVCVCFLKNGWRQQSLHHSLWRLSKNVSKFHHSQQKRKRGPNKEE